MLSRDIIELVTQIDGGHTPLGDPIIIKTYTQVYANKLPIGMSEKYQSNAQGLKPEYKFEIRYIEYSGEQIIRYPITTGQEYSVIRSYTKNDEMIELTLQGVVVNANA